MTSPTETPKKTSTPKKIRTSKKKAALPAAHVTDTQPWFTQEALKFLRGLARHNDREWFEPRKPVFERELKQPMLRLIAEITDAMAAFSPGHIRPAHKVMMRIYRDTRFSKDKTPYKTRIAAWWAHQGLEKTSGGGFYMHLSAQELTIAAGVYMPEKEQLYAIRNYLLSNHQEVRTLLHDAALRRIFSSFEGLPLTRPPKGFPKDHPAMDLLLCKQWGVACELSPEIALTPALAKEVVKRFALAAPLVHALNRPLIAPRGGAQSQPAVKRGNSGANALFPMQIKAIRGQA